MDTGTEVMNIDEMDAIVAAFNADDNAALMEASGQAVKSSGQTGLPRININYDAETEDGKSLPRGSWKMYTDGRFIYADEVVIRPILRTFEYSVWDQESGTFSAKTVQKTSLSGMFPDTNGGNKCGRLTREEEDRLPKDDIAYLNSRAVSCNQILYSKISGTFKDADGNEVVWTMPLAELDQLRTQGFFIVNWCSNGEALQNTWVGAAYKSLTIAKAKVSVQVDEAKQSITLSTNKPAFFVHLESDANGRFSDSSFTLLPQQPISLNYIGDEFEQMVKSLRIYHLANSY